MSVLDPGCCTPHDGHVHVYPIGDGTFRAMCKEHAGGDFELARAAHPRLLRAAIILHRRNVHGFPDIPNPTPDVANG